MSKNDYLIRLIECAFKKQFFHYETDAIHLPCGAVTCNECILVNEDLFCHSCHKTHVYTELQISQLKKDKLCLGIIDTARDSMFEEIFKRSQNLNGNNFIYFYEISFLKSP
jgi:hypothetical protein